MEVCVTGATGFVGGRLVPALLDRGHDVTALVRDRDRYDPPTGVDVVEGDLLDPGSFDEAVDVEAAYYLVHSMASGEDFEERDRRAALTETGYRGRSADGEPAGDRRRPRADEPVAEGDG